MKARLTIDGLPLLIEYHYQKAKEATHYVPGVIEQVFIDSVTLAAWDLTAYTGVHKKARMKKDILARIKKGEIREQDD